MLLSIVIVNYNVKSFLAQCLRSVQQSEGLACGVDYEVFVVDNHSVDDSVEMVREKFPWVRLIANQENTGFAKANNQAIRQSEAKYVLLLNPDTLIENDTLQKCLAFMESHPDAGGLGVKMLDGQGRYLKESKRGVPTPSTAFYKMTGMCKFFPRSKRFASYYMGHLSPDEIHPVEILSGAFMLLRRETLDKVGLLDETFFMYGEDIDLSYRILQGGYRNYYFPHTTIIHYKGESTRKGSLNYVLVFYKAMEIFVKKYFSSGRYKLYLQIIRIAIWLRAALSMLARAFRKVFLPAADFLLSYAVLVTFSRFWAQVFFHDPTHYPPVYRNAVLPVFAAVMMLSCLSWGAYRLPVSLKKTAWGFLTGVAVCLLGGALAGAEWQFSRFTVVAGGLLCLCAACLLRWGVSKIFRKSFPLSVRRNKNYLIIGNRDEQARVQGILQEEGIRPEHIFGLRVNDALSVLNEQIQVNRIGEVIFCAKDLNFDQILLLVRILRKTGVETKTISADSRVRVGYRS